MTQYLRGQVRMLRRPARSCLRGGTAREKPAAAALASSRADATEQGGGRWRRYGGCPTTRGFRGAAQSAASLRSGARAAPTAPALLSAFSLPAMALREQLRERRCGSAAGTALRRCGNGAPPAAASGVPSSIWRNPLSRTPPQSIGAEKKAKKTGEKRRRD